jgi:hypothetical protein
MEYILIGLTTEIQFTSAVLTWRRFEPNLNNLTTYAIW